jgi:hypothetical protein
MIIEDVISILFFKIYELADISFFPDML